MGEWFAADERDPHRAEIADLFDPKLQVFQLGMWLRVIVFDAIGAIEIALGGKIETALQRLAIEEPLARFEQVVAGKFAADSIKQVHGCWTGSEFTGGAACCHAELLRARAANPAIASPLG